MIDIVFEFTGKLQIFPSRKAPWHFISLPKDEAKGIHLFREESRGFGSFGVEARIGSTEWNTSIFRDNQRDTYLLFIKAAVRSAENISVGDDVQIHIRLL